MTGRAGPGPDRIPVRPAAARAGSWPALSWSTPVGTTEETP
jgi:hypothetical protein